MFKSNCKAACTARTISFPPSFLVLAALLRGWLSHSSCEQGAPTKSSAEEKLGGNSMASQKRKAAPSEKQAKAVGTSRSYCRQPSPSSQALSCKIYCGQEAAQDQCGFYRKQQQTSLLEEPGFASENLPPGGGVLSLDDDDDFGGIFKQSRKPP